MFPSLSSFCACLIFQGPANERVAQLHLIVPTVHNKREPEKKHKSTL